MSSTPSEENDRNEAAPEVTPQRNDVAGTTSAPDVDPEIAAIDQGSLDESLKESSSHARGLLSLFILALFYVSVITFSTSHMQLLINNGTVQLPVLGVGIPLKIFYIVAPLFIVAFHLYLLIELTLHAQKVHEWNRRLDSPKKSRRLLFPFLFNYSSHGILPKNPAGRILILLITWLLAYAAPLAVLLMMAVRYLPSHDPAVTTLHRLVIPFDFILLFIYWRVIRNPEWEKEITGKAAEEGLSHIQSLRQRLHNYWRDVRRQWFDLVFAIVIGFAVIRVIDIPETNREVLIPHLIPVEINSIVQRNIDLRGRTISQSVPSDAIMQTYVSMNRSRDSAWIEFSEGISLGGRDLRFAKFSGARLINADFRGADLDHADFSNATLISADFQDARLRGARLDSATLAGARFVSTKAAGASFRHSNIEGAILILTDLRDAALQKANFAGVYISESNFSGADMRDARLDEATITRSTFIATVLTSTTIRAALIRDSRFDAASLFGVSAAGTSIEYTSFVGADLAAFSIICGRLSNVNYTAADLSSSLFDGASLSNVRFVGAAIEAAVFDGASFSSCSFSGIQAQDASFEAIILKGTPEDAFFSAWNMDWQFYRDTIPRQIRMTGKNPFFKMKRYNDRLESAFQDTSSRSPSLLATVTDQGEAAILRQKELACSDYWAAHGLFRLSRNPLPHRSSKAEGELFYYLTQACPSVIDSVRSIRQRRTESEQRFARLRVGVR